jgi:hypothetical protein
MIRHSALLVAAFVFAACTSSASQPSPSVTQTAPSDSSPAGPAPTATSVSESVLLGAWKHHHEKDEGKLQIFVPSEQEIEPARYREILRLNGGGTAHYLCSSSRDAHEFEQGTWSLSGDQLTIDVTCFGEKRTMRYRVVEATKDRLQLEALDA